MRLSRTIVHGSFLASAMLVAGVQPAWPQQRCPPNSYAASVAFAGNLRTAQCFCNPGFQPSGRACVPVNDPTAWPQQPEPSKRLVQPRPSR